MRHDPLAQSVEYLTFNQGVVGSSPTWVTMKKLSLSGSPGRLFLVSELMLYSQLAPKQIFFRQTLSESLGIAPLCLCFLSRLTEKSFVLEERSLKYQFLVATSI